jgi:hypothetical protein
MTGINNAIDSLIERPQACSYTARGFSSGYVPDREMYGRAHVCKQPTGLVRRDHFAIPRSTVEFPFFRGSLEV